MRNTTMEDLFSTALGRRPTRTPGTSTKAKALKARAEALPGGYFGRTHKARYPWKYGYKPQGQPQTVGWYQNLDDLEAQLEEDERKHRVAKMMASPSIWGPA